MKNPDIDPLAAQDIREQVAKVLRGLGNPEPPLNLREVRELLKLDRQFYSATNTSALREKISKLKIGATQVLLRPSLILDVVRKADLRALWLPDRKRILIDESLPELKQRHAESHEIIHSVTPHHAPFFLGDDGVTLRHSCYEKLESEANFGSGQLLFHLGLFSEMAKDMPHSLESVKKLSKIFGNTMTMSLWRLVEEGARDEAIFGVISTHPHHPEADFDPNDPCRYFIESPKFRKRFGRVTEMQAFGAIRQYATWNRGGPLGRGEAHFMSNNGETHLFQMETFCNTYDALTIGVDKGPRKVQVLFSRQKKVICPN